MVAYKIEGGETLNLRSSQNFTGANKDLKKAFGLGMRVLTPSGGGRTPAQQQAMFDAGQTDTRPANSDHVKYRAIDIDNQRTFRNANEAKFLAILKAWGWRQTVSDEPWHFVNDEKNRTAPVDPNPRYQVYYCTDGIGKGWWYVVGNGKIQRTRIPAKKNLWIRKHGYGGTATYAQIQAFRQSPTGK